MVTELLISLSPLHAVQDHRGLLEPNQASVRERGRVQLSCPSQSHTAQTAQANKRRHTHFQLNLNGYIHSHSHKNKSIPHNIENWITLFVSILVFLNFSLIFGINLCHWFCITLHSQAHKQRKRSVKMPLSWRNLVEICNSEVASGLGSYSV